MSAKVGSARINADCGYGYTVAVSISTRHEVLSGEGHDWESAGGCEIGLGVDVYGGGREGDPGGEQVEVK